MRSLGIERMLRRSLRVSAKRKETVVEAAAAGAVEVGAGVLAGVEESDGKWIERRGKDLQRNLLCTVLDCHRWNTSAVTLRTSKLSELVRR